MSEHGYIDIMDLLSLKKEDLVTYNLYVKPEKKSGILLFIQNQKLSGNTWAGTEPHLTKTSNSLRPLPGLMV